MRSRCSRRPEGSSASTITGVLGTEITNPRGQRAGKGANHAGISGFVEHAKGGGPKTSVHSTREETETISEQGPEQGENGLR